MFTSLFLLFFIPIAAMGQLTIPPVPADADAFFQKAITEINPKHASWIKKTSFDVNTKKMDEQTIHVAVTQYATLSGLRSKEIEGLTSLLLTQVSKQAYNDIFKLMEQMDGKRKEKAAIQNAVQLLEKYLEKNETDKIEIPRYEYDSLAKLKTIDSVKNKSTPLRSGGPITKGEIEQLKKNLRNKEDSLGTMSEKLTQIIQKAQNRYNEFINSLSNLLRKISDTQDSIIQNMK